MASLDFAALAMQAAADLHQASAIVGHHRLGAALADARQLVGQHRAGQMRELDREQSAEAAALGAVTQLEDAYAVDRAQKRARLVDNLKLAQQMARSVISDRTLVARADVLDAQHVHQEIRELADPRANRLGARAQPRMTLE